jgi:hypothetical protein
MILKSGLQPVVRVTLAYADTSQCVSENTLDGFHSFRLATFLEGDCSAYGDRGSEGEYVEFVSRRSVLIKFIGLCIQEAIIHWCLIFDTGCWVGFQDVPCVLGDETQQDA